MAKKPLIALLALCVALAAHGDDPRLASMETSDASAFYQGNPYFQGPYALKVDEVRRYFEKIQLAIRSDDVAWLAGNITYPLKMGEGRHKLVIKDVADLKADYRQVITPVVKSAVACQTFDTLFANSDGIMIGRGAIWFSRVYLPDVQRRAAGRAPVATPATELSRSLDDNSKWGYRIIFISGDDGVADFVKDCQSGKVDIDP